MLWLVRFAKSSIGAKVLMALTGIVLVLFVLVHMLGNLQIFLGQEAYNSYAHFLQSKPGLVWTARLSLLAAVLLHIVSSLRLAALNRAARPVAYTLKRFRRAPFNSRTMVLSGLTLLSFIVYHLLHFTVGAVHGDYYGLIDGQGRTDVYTNFLMSFKDPRISAAYSVSMLLLGLHLSHGIASMFQSLGINHPRLNPLIRCVGPGLAWIIALGNISMPLAVYFGLLGPI